MSEKGKKIPIPKELTDVGVETMTEMLPQKLSGGEIHCRHSTRINQG
jgi:ABC-type thiamine transport system ATPase subunit